MVEELSVESKEIVATDLLSYVVQKGDIYSISKKFDLKVEVLKQKIMPDNTLSIGQRLVVNK
jgi:LysM repeat protein